MVSKLKETQPSLVTRLYRPYTERLGTWGKAARRSLVTSDYKLVFGARPLGANHDKFPFNVIVFEPEAYGILPRGQPEILEHVQDTVNWLINSHFYSVRKILNGQYVVDGSRIAISDMLDPQHGGVIRMKPAGYGTNPNAAYAQMSAVDVTQNHLRDLEVMYTIGQRAVGVNDQLMGFCRTPVVRPPRKFVRRQRLA
jgi:hypothetical protein